MISSNNSFECGINTSNNNCVISKLRRLKIQESVLTANLGKCFALSLIETVEHTEYNNDLQLKKFICKLKDLFREVKHLFEEITIKTNDQELSENTDIDELKKDIIVLETKIRSAKKIISNELQLFQNEENTLMDEVEAVEVTNEQFKIKRKNKEQLKDYKAIIPSPVRVMINSPFKCVEVQRFQDFLKNSPNRYGGWNEYNHNIFCQIWTKYYGDLKITTLQSIEDTYSYQNFIEEVLEKIQGVTRDGVDSHSKWFFEYIQLKGKQQLALNKWKENKRKLNPPRKVRQIKTNNTMDETTVREIPKQIKLCRKQNYENLKCRSVKDQTRGMSTDNGSTEGTTNEIRSSHNVDISRLMRPTKQSISYRDSAKETNEIFRDIERVAKLATPNWRLTLRE